MSYSGKNNRYSFKQPKLSTSTTNIPKNFAFFPKGLCSREEVDKTAEQQIYQKLNSVSSYKSTSEFEDGNIKNFIEDWKDIAIDFTILDIVENRLKIDFLNIPGNLKVLQIPHCVSEKEIIAIEIKSLLRKEVIVEASRESGNFISTVFTRKRKSGIFRFILNLKYLNDLAVLKHAF